MPAPRCYHYMLFGNDGRAAIFCVAGLGGEPLPQAGGHFGLQRLGAYTRFDSPDDIEPVAVRHVQVCVRAIDHRLQCERDPDRRRVAGDPVSVESGRGYANYGHGLALQIDGRANHAGVGAEVRLPGLVAQHRDWSRPRGVVGVGQHTPGKRGDSEGGEVVPRDILAALRLGLLGAVSQAH